MNKVLTSNIWPELKKLKKKSSYFKAAIGYASSGTALGIKKNDVLVCDASVEAIRCGHTSAKLIKQILKKGGQVYNLPGLHSKIYVFDDATFIGSANLSQHSSTGGLIEGGILSTDVSICSDAANAVMELAAAGELILPKYLKKILKIRVQRSPNGSRKIKRPPKIKSARTHWLLGVHHRNDTNDVEAFEAGYETLGVDSDSDEVYDIQYATSFVVKKGFKVNDLVTEIYRKNGKDKHPQIVYHPRRILHIEKGKRSSYLYLQSQSKKVSWRNFCALLKKHGIRKRVSKDTNSRAGDIGDLMLDLASSKLKER